MEVLLHAHPVDTLQHNHAQCRPVREEGGHREHARRTWAGSRVVNKRAGRTPPLTRKGWGHIGCPGWTPRSVFTFMLMLQCGQHSLDL